VQTPVFLEHWKWLNNDNMPHMNNSLEVYDGSAWIVLWQSGSNDYTMSSWNKYIDDVSIYENAAFRIRFGVEVGSQGADVVSSWNIDDVRLVPSTSCP
jgi:hypothetical protein